VQWVSTSVTEDGQDRPLEPGTAISLAFTEDQVAASAGCNSMSGSTSWEGDVLVVSRVGGTEMGCDPPLMRQDEWLVGVLSSRPVVEVNEAGMTLTSGGLVLSFADREVAMPDTALEGTTWVLDGIGQGGGEDGSMSSVPGGVRSTLRIVGGNVGVKPGCNTGGGDVEVSESTLSFGTIMTTLMACPGARDDVEKTVLSVLQGEVDYRIEGDVLTLTNGEQTLVYRAETG
jgi:heat shock protein HslJ